MIASSDIVAAFPELSVVTSGTWTYAIDAAYADLNAVELGTRLDSVATALAAHYASLATAGLARGLVVDESVGPVRRAYANVSKMDGSDLSLTRYGMMARRMMRNTVTRWVVG